MGGPRSCKGCKSGEVNATHDNLFGGGGEIPSPLPMMQIVNILESFSLGGLFGGGGAATLGLFFGSLLTPILILTAVPEGLPLQLQQPGQDIGIAPALDADHGA